MRFEVVVVFFVLIFFFQAEDGIRDTSVTGVQTCALPILYDAVVEAVPMAAGGRNQKKAVVIISDGNDTASRAGVHEVRQLIRNSEVLVYAIEIGRASCRERVEISGVAGAVKT